MHYRTVELAALLCLESDNCLVIISNTSSRDKYLTKSRYFDQRFSGNKQDGDVVNDVDLLKIVFGEIKIVMIGHPVTKSDF